MTTSSTLTASPVTAGLFAGALQAAGIANVELAPGVEVPERHRTRILVAIITGQEVATLNAWKENYSITVVSGPTSTIAGYRPWRDQKDMVLDSLAQGYISELVWAVKESMRVRPLSFPQFKGMDLDVAIQATLPEKRQEIAIEACRNIRLGKFRVNSAMMIKARFGRGHVEPGVIKSYIVQDYSCQGDGKEHKGCGKLYPKISTLKVEAIRDQAVDQFFCDECHKRDGSKFYLQPVEGSQQDLNRHIETVYPKMEEKLQKFLELADARGEVKDPTILQRHPEDIIARQFAVMKTKYAPGVWTPKTDIEAWAEEAYAKCQDGYAIRPFAMVRRWAGLQTCHLKWICPRVSVGWVPRAMLLPIRRFKDDTPEHKRGELVYKEDACIDPGYHSQFLVPKSGSRKAAEKSGSLMAPDMDIDIEVED